MGESIEEIRIGGKRIKIIGSPDDAWSRALCLLVPDYRLKRSHSDFLQTRRGSRTLANIQPSQIDPRAVCKISMLLVPVSSECPLVSVSVFIDKTQ